MNIKTMIRHRVNTKAELLTLDKDLGVEIDLRTHADSVILNHDPFKDGERAESYFKGFNHNTCILNTKVDGLEETLIELMDKHSISDYFFLDTAIPTMVKHAKTGFTKFAVRFSEYEPIEFVQQFQNKAEWVWVDCFTKNILTGEAYLYLKKYFKICIVSPELQSHPFTWIDNFKTEFNGFEIDAVCSKRPDLWK